MTTTACIIARLDSRRLPRKAFVDVCGRTALDRLVRRIRSATTVDEVVLCTTSRPGDAELVRLAGSETDVLSRLITAGHETGADRLVRVTGDNILTWPATLDRLSRALDESGAQYARANNLPIGATPEVFTLDLAEDLHRRVDGNRTEYLLLYAFDPDAHRCVALSPPEHLARPEFSLTLDTPDDLARLRTIHSDVAHLPEEGPTLSDVCVFLDDRKGLGTIPQDTPIRLPTRSKPRTERFWKCWKSVVSAPSKSPGPRRVSNAPAAP